MMLSSYESVKISNVEELKKQGQQKRSYIDMKRPEDVGEFNLSMTIYKRIKLEERRVILNRIKEIEEEYKGSVNHSTTEKIIDSLSELNESFLQHNLNYISMMFPLVASNVRKKSTLMLSI